MPGMRLKAFVKGEPAGKPVDLDGERFLAGRGKECDLVLRVGRVSRRHSLLILVHGHWMIQDLDSSNGTYLNDRRINYAELRLGDSFRLGKEGPRFDVAALDPVPPRRPLDDRTITRILDLELTPAPPREEQGHP